MTRIRINCSTGIWRSGSWFEIELACSYRQRCRKGAFGRYVSEAGETIDCKLIVCVEKDACAGSMNRLPAGETVDGPRNSEARREVKPGRLPDWRSFGSKRQCLRLVDVSFDGVRIASLCFGRGRIELPAEASGNGQLWEGAPIVLKVRGEFIELRCRGDLFVEDQNGSAIVHDVRAAEIEGCKGRRGRNDRRYNSAVINSKFHGMVPQRNPQGVHYIPLMQFVLWISLLDESKADSRHIDQ